jgi:hypothetical protein
MTTTVRSSLLESRLARGASAARQKEIRSVGAALCEARLGAESMDNTALTYFIDMAIAELRNMTTVHREIPRMQNGRKRSKVIRFLNSPAKGALRTRYRSAYPPVLDLQKGTNKFGPLVRRGLSSVLGFWRKRVL